VKKISQNGMFVTPPQSGFVSLFSRGQPIGVNCMDINISIKR